MGFFETQDKVRLAFTDDGEGLPVLALAGLTRDGRDFDYLAPHLPEGIRLIRLDSRGRGRSGWAPPETYTVAQEAQDAIALLDHLGIDRAAILGTSRGGLIGMLLGLSARDRLLGLCLNDVGPVLERDGLLRIGAYVGFQPAARTLEEITRQLPLVSTGFDGVPESRWREEAERHFVQLEGRVGLTYDPALAAGFQAVRDGPLPEAWPLFEACFGLPLALIRGANSDLLSAATAAEMKRRCPALMSAEVPGRAHIPFLDEPEALAVILPWLEAVRHFATLPAPPTA